MSVEAAFEVGRLLGPLKEIANTLSAAQSDLFIRLPGLIGYFPMGPLLWSTGAAVNHAQGGVYLLEQGDCPVGYDGNSYRHLGNGTNYLYNGGYSASGLETWIDASMRGLTIGGWFSVDSLPSVEAGLATKFGVVTNYGYAMTVKASGEVQAVISGNGSSLNVIAGGVIGTGQWHFLAMRFTPSTELAVFVSGVKDTNTSAIASSIYASSQDFEIGRHNNDNSQIAHARARDVFICQAILSDELIEEVRQSSLP